MKTEEFSKLPEPIALVVVDDEPIIRMNTPNIIADEGYSIVEATTADEAYAFLDRHSSLQLFFTDVQMPGELNGFAPARKVQERWPHICVIVASGMLRLEVGDLPSNARFVSKPFSAVRRALNRVP